MVLQCQAENYAPAIIENSRKAEDYEVLEYAQRKSEYPFVRFLVDEMKRTFRIIKKYSISHFHHQLQIMGTERYWVSYRQCLNPHCEWYSRLLSLINDIQENKRDVTIFESYRPDVSYCSAHIRSTSDTDPGCYVYYPANGFHGCHVLYGIGVFLS